MTNEQFIDTLHFAQEAKSEFCGILYGRATWKDGIETFAKEGKEVYYQLLKTKGIENLDKVKEAVSATATPWSVFAR